ncbi:hypothetical protein KOR42_09280 [Thalassoglobus neptunius]|uniref:Uncharacterized protein n=1 Tax=Thalassoglobus neptunius TaxID=1938619 RepID=A0A5C5X3N3_9PLAN|nr:hypothetical protein KOR42_09280 [Thalassoglobus neptunius]
MGLAIRIQAGAGRQNNCEKELETKREFQAKQTSAILKTVQTPFVGPT